MSAARRRRYAAAWRRYQRHCDAVAERPRTSQPGSAVAVPRGFFLATEGWFAGLVYTERRGGRRTYYGRGLTSTRNAERRRAERRRRDFLPD